MRIAMLLAAVMLTACSHVQYTASNGAVATSSSAVVLSTSSGAAIAFLLTLGVVDYVNNPQPFPSPLSLLSPAPPPAPELAASRRISEQDCSKPVDLSLGNLRCK
jgi:hypothetical protein